ncbi:ferrous iron transporter B [Micromonospora eburnea]|uniref:Ferrous iron transport protein B n=1 Tax=Micromonospora eburnea TaxID=227316 RepID=A0A1C6UXI9_9ACTN|nr:ferrous iron transport protein B [Micromonospora eburnea]
MTGCHQEQADPRLDDAVRVALVGSPNAGKTTLFNSLTGLRAKTGNYPGVTVARYVGTCVTAAGRYRVEDLPGAYSLDPISPDEQVMVDALDGRPDGSTRPDALLLVVDATTLRRSMNLVAQVLARGLPACVVLTFTDDLARRQGHLDVDGFARALGVPVVAVRRGRDRTVLRDRLDGWREWTVAPVPPPVDPVERDAWAESVLAFAGYQGPRRHRTTDRVDAVLLHPVGGVLVFFLVMALFFQTIFTLAAPLQDGVAAVFAALGELVHRHVDNPWLSGLLGDALIGGVGGVLVFVPQIALMFLLLALLEGVGYLPRAAFLMDRVMARAGLEGRAFVALLSAFACAIPGIMATRTLPSARDRLATMMAAPLITCSARLPVYVLLVGLLVDPAARIGPFGVQGLVMFGLYLLGAVSAMVAAWAFTRIVDRRALPVPFYLELPPYRWPAPRAVLTAVADAAGSFLRKCTRIILITSIALWLLLNLPMHDAAELRAAGVDTTDRVAVATYGVNHSYAADLGHLVAPVFAPLGFDWRINVGVLSAQSARESFVATLGQVAAAEQPENPEQALRELTYTDGPRAGQPLFTAPVLAALLVYFAYALQCTATVGVIRRETGTWRWPLVAFAYLTGLAWVMAFLARSVTALLVG